MRKWIFAGVAALAWVGAARAEVKLFAKYDWKDGAKDVAGAVIRHDGELEPGAAIAGGKLVLDGWDGVSLGEVPELNDATEVLFRFEDVTITQYGPPGSEPAGNFPVLAGDGMKWWVGVDYAILPEAEQKTWLVFYLGGYGNAGLGVVAADRLVNHFDSIEYRLNGAAPVNERFGIRWNDGPWVVGGAGEDAANRMPETEAVRINNGGPADWDPMWGSMGTVSMYSNTQVPEPGAMGLVVVAGLVLNWRRRRD